MADDQPGGDTLPAGTGVLVTGATGFTGKVLTRRLAGMGAEVRAIARPGSDLTELDDLPIRWFRGQVYDAATVERAARGVAYIFHLAAAYRDAGIDDEQYRRVHVHSTQLLAEQACRQPGFRRFVHTSTVGVHGDVGDRTADETAPFNPGDIYQRTKVEAEVWFREFATERRLPFAVIRPAAIYGPGDRRLLKVFRMAARGWCLLLDRRDIRYHLIHVDDLVQGLLLCAVHPAADAGVFICGNRMHTTLQAIVRTAARALERRVRFVSLPAGPVMGAAAVCEAVCKRCGWKPPLYRRRVAFFTKHRAFDTSRIHAQLGFREALDNDEGVRRTAQWYAREGWL